jgi:hypothetical protein
MQGGLQVLKIRAAKFVHDAFREGERLRPKTWGKKERNPHADRRQNKRALNRGDFE